MGELFITLIQKYFDKAIFAFYNTDKMIKGEKSFGVLK